MQEDNGNTKEPFVKNLIKAALEEAKSVSTRTVAVVLVCAMIAVLGLNICASNATINTLKNQNADIIDKLSATEDELKQNIEELEDSLEASNRDSEEKDKIIQEQQNALADSEAAKDKLVGDLQEQIENLDLTEYAVSRSDSEINSVKNGIAELELSIRDVLGYTDKANELIDVLYSKADAMQDKLDRYPDFYPTEGSVGSPFGYRVHPIDGVTKFHKGIDIGTGVGTPIFAAAKGVVKFVGTESGYGLYVLIDHGDGFVTNYAHLSEAFVKVGDTVEKGEHIAAMGATGRVTGSHLHFEVILDGVYRDPADYIL